MNTEYENKVTENSKENIQLEYIITNAINCSRDFLYDCIQDLRYSTVSFDPRCTLWILLYISDFLLLLHVYQFLIVKIMWPYFGINKTKLYVLFLFYLTECFTMWICSSTLHNLYKHFYTYWNKINLNIFHTILHVSPAPRQL